MEQKRLRAKNLRVNLQLVDVGMDRNGTTSDGGESKVLTRPHGPHCGLLRPREPLGSVYTAELETLASGPLSRQPG